jgi:hypothetical protein
MRQHAFGMELHAFDRIFTVAQPRAASASVWAQDDGLKKQFPELARKTTGSAEGRTTVMSAYEGWEVPDYSKPVIE